MKKTLSLIAIACLLLSLGLVSNVFANAPVYPEVPSIKLFTNGVGLTPAFDLAQFNTAPDGFNADVATSYSIVVNFLGNSSLSSSSWSGYISNVNQGGYSVATAGSNTYAMTNAGGSVSASTVSNSVKFATYRQNEFKKYGLSVGESVTVAVSSFTAGNVAAAAPSFGNPTAIIVSDTTKVTAVWNAASTAVVITLNVGTSAPVTVDVVASPVGSASTYSNVWDQDKERIAIYTNQFTAGVFSSSANTTAWGLEGAPGRTALATQTWLATDTDSQGNGVNGVWQFALGSANGGIKGTPLAADYQAVANGNWYISRMLLFDKTSANADQALLFSFGNTAAAGVTADITADVYATGIPTVETWMEAPVYIHGPSGTTGYPQFQLKGSGANSVDIAEIQFIQATPRLLDGTRGGIRSFIKGGLFAQSTSTTLWGTELYYNSVNAPSASLASDTIIGSCLSFNFAGAGAVPNALGTKWTYGAPGSVITPAAPVGRQHGAQMELTNTIPSGSSELSQALVVAYGVSSANYVSAALDRIEAAAEVGVVVNGTLTAVGTATDPYAQVQFGFRGDASGIVNISNVDYLADNNDPNFGNQALFP